MRHSVVLFAFITVSAWGMSSPFFRHQLSSETNLGVKKNWELARTAGGYRLNGLVLAPERIVRHSDTLKKLQDTVPAKTATACPAGNYTFRTTRPGNPEVVERGCLGSERFGQLREVFEQLARR